MKAELKQKWIEALRSGNYKKNVGNLKYNNSFCCLGVLCDVIGCKWEKDIEGGEYTTDADEEVAECFLTEELLKRTELDRSTAMDLAKKNDGGWSFNKIADLIEKEC